MSLYIFAVRSLLPVVSVSVVTALLALVSATQSEELPAIQPVLKPAPAARAMLTMGSARLDNAVVDDAIVFGGPLTLSEVRSSAAKAPVPSSCRHLMPFVGQGAANYMLCRHLHNALFLLATWINTIVGGIRLSKNETRRLEIILIDDGADEGAVKGVSTAMLAGRSGGRPVDFLFAPYSSGLAEVASKLANEHGALLMAGGASATSVYKNRALSFGMLSPSTMFLRSGVELLHARGIRSIVLLSEFDSASIQFVMVRTQLQGSSAFSLLTQFGSRWYQTARKSRRRLLGSTRQSPMPLSVALILTFVPNFLSKRRAIRGFTCMP
jgi:hypothetical protein